MYINNKTNFSNMQGVITHQQLIDFALENKLPAIGICDIDCFDGANQFTKLSTSQGVNPILCVDTSVMFRDTIENVLLICTGDESRREINKGLSSPETSDYHQYQTTIVVFKNTNIRDIATKDYYGLVRNDLVNFQSIAENYLLIDDVYLGTAKDLEYFKIVMAIKEKRTVKELRPLEFANKYLQTYNLEDKLFSQLYDNYLSLIKKISPLSISSDFKLPKFTTGSNLDNNIYLKQLATRGLSKRLHGQISSEYQQRLDYELEVITNLNYVDYFLIVWDIIKHCRKNNIFYGPGRGSSAGSLVAYCLGITNIDPIVNRLIFERFLNPARSSMPDIDIDFDSEHRDLVLDYMFERYGEDHTCRIRTYALYKSKASFEAIAKAVGIEDKTITTVLKMINNDLSFKENLKANQRLSDVMAFDGKLRFIIDYIFRLENNVKNFSIHASGVIITNEQIYNYTAVNNRISANNASELESLGLVKFDILAISVLTTIRKIEQRIVDELAIKLDFKTIAIDDERVYQGISNGLNCGIFQLEQSYAKDALMTIKPENFSEFAAILALIRPGANTQIPRYISNKESNSNQIIHPDLIEVLESTHGVILYQEQVMEIVQIIGGFSLEEADNFRRAISKKDELLLNAELEKFKQAASENNYQSDVIAKLITMISAFGEYGFNKAHTYSYGIISYALFYYKILYPAQFYSTILENGVTDSILSQIKFEFEQLGITIKHPLLSNLSLHPTFKNNNFNLGLSNISTISESDGKLIYDLITKLNTSDPIQIIEHLLVEAKLSKTQVKHLVASGLFVNSEYNERTLDTFINEYNLDQDLTARLFFKVEVNVDTLDNYDLATLEQNELASLKINIRFNTYKTLFNQYLLELPNLVDLNQINKQPLFTEFDTIVYIDNIKETVDSKGNKMGFIKANIENNPIEIVVFSDIYDQFYDQLVDLESYALVRLKVNKRGLNLQNIKKL